MAKEIGQGDWRTAGLEEPHHGQAVVLSLPNDGSVCAVEYNAQDHSWEWTDGNGTTYRTTVYPGDCWFPLPTCLDDPRTMFHRSDRQSWALVKER